MNNKNNNVDHRNLTRTLSPSRIRGQIDFFSNLTGENRNVQLGEASHPRLNAQGSSQNTCLLPKSLSTTKIETSPQAEINKTTSPLPVRDEKREGKVGHVRQRSISYEDPHKTFVLPENKERANAKQIEEKENKLEKNSLKEEQGEVSSPRKVIRQLQKVISFTTAPKTTLPKDHSKEIKILEEIKGELDKEFEGLSSERQKQFKNFCKGGVFFPLKRKYVTLLEKESSKETVKEEFKKDFLASLNLK